MYGYDILCEISKDSIQDILLINWKMWNEIRKALYTTLNDDQLSLVYGEYTIK